MIASLPLSTPFGGGWRKFIRSRICLRQHRMLKIHFQFSSVLSPSFKMAQRLDLRCVLRCVLLLGCRGSQPKHVSIPAFKKQTILLMADFFRLRADRLPRRRHSTAATVRYVPPHVPPQRGPSSTR